MSINYLPKASRSSASSQSRTLLMEGDTISQSAACATFRVYQTTIIATLAAFMQGYDSGVAGGVLTFDSFSNDFGYSLEDDKDRVNSLTVGLLQLGAFVCSLCIFALTDAVGRKTAIQVSAAIFIVGTIIETINTHSLPAWYVGRFVAGFGQGGCSVVVPIYIAEMAEKERRGKLGSCFQWMYTWGIFTAYWVNYGVKIGISETASAQWQLPIGLQLVSSSLLFIGIFTLPESVRWLVKKGRPDEALRMLCWIRGASKSDPTPSISAEFASIVSGVKEENAAREGLTFRELFTPANRKRFAMGSSLFILQQCTGATALAYFSPQFFQLVVGTGNTQLLVTGLFGAVKVIACTTFIVFVAERFRRTRLLSFGALAMSACMLSTALVYKFLPPVVAADGTVAKVGAAQRATIALIFLNIVAYNFSWGPLPWAICPELFPTRMRALGQAVSMMSHWLWAFVFSISTPPMISAMGWGTFLFYALLDVLMALFVLFFLKETKDKSLERIQKEIQQEKIVHPDTPPENADPHVSSEEESPHGKSVNTIN